LSFSSSVCMSIVFISVNTMHAPAPPMKEFIHRHHYSTSVPPHSTAFAKKIAVKYSSSS
jgi:hypothetical protein